MYEKRLKRTLKKYLQKGGHVGHLAADGLFWVAAGDLTLAELFLAEVRRL